MKHLRNHAKISLMHVSLNILYTINLFLALTKQPLETAVSLTDADCLTDWFPQSNNSTLVLTLDDIKALIRRHHIIFSAPGNSLILYFFLF